MDEHNDAVENDSRNDNTGAVNDNGDRECNSLPAPSSTNADMTKYDVDNYDNGIVEFDGEDIALGDSQALKALLGFGVNNDSLTMLDTMNEKTISICKKLYFRHKDAINLIMLYGKPNLPICCIADFHAKTDTVSIFGEDCLSKRHYHVFIPESWAGIVPANGKHSGKYLVAFELNFRDYESHKINLLLWIGHFPVKGEKKRLIEMLKAQDKKGKLIFGPGNKGVLLKKTVTLEYKNGRKYDLSKYDSIKTKIIEAYNADDVQQALKIVDKVVRSFPFEDKGKAGY